MVRRLIWLRNPKDFQLSVWDGVSPGSSVCIWKGKTDGWSLLAKGRGSRSCVLVALIICSVCSVNCCSMRGLFDFRMFVSHGSHFLIICLESEFWDGDITGRESPGWGNSWFRTWSLWRLSRGGKKVIRRRRLVLHRVHFLHFAIVLVKKDVVTRF